MTQTWSNRIDTRVKSVEDAIDSLIAKHNGRIEAVQDILDHAGKVLKQCDELRARLSSLEKNTAAVVIAEKAVIDDIDARVTSLEDSRGLGTS